MNRTDTLDAERGSEKNAFARRINFPHGIVVRQFAINSNEESGHEHELTEHTRRKDGVEDQGCRAAFWPRPINDLQAHRRGDIAQRDGGRESPDSPP